MTFKIKEKIAQKALDNKYRLRTVDRELSKSLAIGIVEGLLSTGVLISNFDFILKNLFDDSFKDFFNQDFEDEKQQKFADMYNAVLENYLSMYSNLEDILEVFIFLRNELILPPKDVEKEKTNDYTWHQIDSIENFLKKFNFRETENLETYEHSKNPIETIANIIGNFLVGLDEKNYADDEIDLLCEINEIITKFRTARGKIKADKTIELLRQTMSSIE